MWLTGPLSDDDGYTLLELLVVIALLAIMGSAATLSVMRMTFGHSIEKTANLLETNLGRVARDARDTAQDQFVVLRRSPSGTLVIAGMRKIVVPQNIEVDWVAAAELGTSNERAALIFLGAGGATGGEIKLSSDGVVMRLHVDWLTGRVTRQNTT